MVIRSCSLPVSVSRLCSSTVGATRIATLRTSTEWIKSNKSLTLVRIAGGTLYYEIPANISRPTKWRDCFTFEKYSRPSFVSITDREFNRIPGTLRLIINESVDLNFLCFQMNLIALNLFKARTSSENIVDRYKAT